MNAQRFTHASLVALVAAAWLHPASVCRAGATLCPADLTGDGLVNIDDIDAFVAAYLAGDARADIDGDGDHDSDDIDAFVGRFLDADADADADRLSDCAERRFGTDPLHPDTDGDGLSDADETIGTATGVDLASMGANPLRKTILIETDWHAGIFSDGVYRDHRPQPAMLALVSQTFANAPLLNPDGSTGVDVFVDYGQGGAFTGGSQLPNSPDSIAWAYQFDRLKARHFSPDRQGYFHYCIMTDRYNSTTNVGTGIAELNGDDFIVSMNTQYTHHLTSGIFSHELGHNLGLHHGGANAVNHKPNYNSLMNYRYLGYGMDLDGDAIPEFGTAHSFSSGTNPPIDEAALDEAAGIDGVTPIDWNGNGVIDALPYSYNISCLWGTTRPCGVGDINCSDTDCTVISDSDDWATINWQRLQNEDRRADRPVVECHPPAAGG